MIIEIRRSTGMGKKEIRRRGLDGVRGGKIKSMRENMGNRQSSRRRRRWRL